MSSQKRKCVLENALEKKVKDSVARAECMGDIK